MDNIEIGLIGCGKQAEKHVNSLKKIPNIDLVVTDKDIAIAKSLAEKLSLTYVNNPDELFQNEKLKAVVICTPTSSHFNLIRRAMENGKDVFCEKPLCVSIEEIQSLKKLQVETGRIVMVGYIYRFVPVFEEGYRLFSKQKLNANSMVFGKTLSAYFRLGGRGSHQAWKHKKASEGGAINEMLVHMIDLANWYFGPLNNVDVISHDIRSQTREIKGEMIQADAEDFILLKCHGNTGEEIICQADLITPSFSQYIEIQSENGSFMASIQPEMPSYVFLKEARGGYDLGKTVIQYGMRNVLDIQMAAFVYSVVTGTQPNRNRIDDSLMLMDIMNGINKQINDSDMKR